MFSKKKKKKLHRDSLILILYVGSEPAVSKITAQHSVTWMGKTGWLFLFPCFCFIFTVLYNLVAAIGFYPVKLQLGKETDAIGSKFTIKWKICMSFGHYFRFIDTFPEKTDAFTVVLKIFWKWNVTRKDLPNA